MIAGLIQIKNVNAKNKMTNLKLLETKIEERNSMMKFLLNAEDIEFDDALKLNSEIALNSMKIKMMKKYPYSILQKDADDWYLEQNSKINKKQLI